MTYEQPEAGEQPTTRVIGFTLSRTSLEVKLSRDSEDYGYAMKLPPRIADVPPDYVAALMDWIRGALR